jgi:hypothetical protein
MKAGELAAFLESHAAALPEDDAPEEVDPRVANGKAPLDDSESSSSTKEKSKKSKEEKSAFQLISPDPEKFEAGLYKLNAADPQRLKAPGFIQPFMSL